MKNVLRTIMFLVGIGLFFLYGSGIIESEIVMNVIVGVYFVICLILHRKRKHFYGWW